MLDRRLTPGAFRESVRSWIRSTLPPDWRTSLSGKSEAEVEDFRVWWMRQLAEAGLCVPTLPVEFGGAGLEFSHDIAVADELARAHSPSLDLFMVTRTHTPATLLQWGSQVQKAKYLPSVARGEIWCQGFSEPNAGSDLVSLRTTAVRDGDCYVVNGQKIWSSFSRRARYCLLLARTDRQAQKRKGISYFILDMRAPGVEVRPIGQITGHSDFSEIFLTDVRIPCADLVGEENAGWRVAQSTLSAERGVLAFERTERLWYHVLRFLAHARAREARWLSDAEIRRSIVDYVGRLQSVRRLIRKLLEESPGERKGTTLPFVVKLASTKVGQELCDLLVRVGPLDQQLHAEVIEADFSAAMFDHLHSFGETISAGTNEIMRNLIAERELGLPR